MDFNIKYNYYLNIFNNYLDNFLNTLDNTTEKLKEGIIYSIKDCGKRVRPILCLASAEMLGVDIEKVLPFALSIELIHSYSLVHDDLECMDNDDYRRGKLSTHKKYGEAMGVLIGDALLNLAIENASKYTFDKNTSKILNEIFKYSGYQGMVKGQVLDMDENKILSKEYLYDVYLNKTAKMLISPLIVSSLFAEKYTNEMYEYGYNLGVLFQITDDILDIESTIDELGKSTNKDAKENKITAVRLFGIEGAKTKAMEHFNASINIISKIDKIGFLTKFTEYIYERKK